MMTRRTSVKVLAGLAFLVASVIVSQIPGSWGVIFAGLGVAAVILGGLGGLLALFGFAVFAFKFLMLTVHLNLEEED